MRASRGRPSCWRPRPPSQHKGRAEIALRRGIGGRTSERAAGRCAGPTRGPARSAGPVSTRIAGRTAVRLLGKRRAPCVRPGFTLLARRRSFATARRFGRFGRASVRAGARFGRADHEALPCAELRWSCGPGQPSSGRGMFHGRLTFVNDDDLVRSDRAHASIPSHGNDGFLVCVAITQSLPLGGIRHPLG